MKNFTLRNILIGIGIIVLIFFGFVIYKHLTQPRVTLKSAIASSSLAALGQISKTPSLSLLHGKLIILSERQQGNVTPDDAYHGTAYILVQYPEDISGSSTGILAEPAKVVPVADMTFFKKMTGQDQGVLNLQQIKSAGLVLAYYNLNGWLLVTSINNINYDQLTYNVAQQTVMLQSHDHQQGKNLFGQLKEYP